MKGFLAVLVFLFAAGPGTWAQQSGPSANAQQAPSTKPQAVPVTMTECEGTNNCATWTFLGSQGNGQWPSGETASLNVDKYDNDSVVIRRADSTGSSAGLTAVYTGARHGDRVGGDYTSSWPGHWNIKSGSWYATVQKNALSPPSVMRECTTPDYKFCYTWTWNEGHYDGVISGHPAKMTVESFAPGSVVMNRTDSGSGIGYSAIFTGKISHEGNSIVAGEWSDSNGSAGHFSATWGAALRDLPAGGQLSQAVTVRPVVVCYPWFFSVVCQ